MKSRRLTETDLANMSFLPVEAKRARIEAIIKPKRIIGSYEPFRSTAGDALNEQFPFFFEDQGATPLGKLEEAVAKACKGDPTLLKMNLAVARATHSFATARKLSAERLSVRPITLAFGHAYEFGMPLIMRFEGVACVAFPDLRRTGPLTTRGSRFVGSMMHQRFRVNYPDFRDLRREIWRYQDTHSREIKPIPCSEADLISYDDLSADVAESYAILHSAMLHDEERRRHATHRDAGPLFSTSNG
ncbi:hypothetical protein Q9Q95_12580 [Sphingomonas sp. DG1-23]|uniref:hypothetical protein n=1 Tax=Sphingomonas sp. DG1-23 TaxID=3068316 RepID=UPI00273FC789|nr:hypothetical protein [Sphingomonas sp. DG1-23]MDP5279761.1 hypothetical protein [Sphingomonas sp. DG1-23]